MELTITLNLPYNLSDYDWEKVSTAYKQMDGWIDSHDYPYWFGTEDGV